jgi:hypothetical protein
MKAIFGPSHTLSHSKLTSGRDCAASLRRTSALWSELYTGESYVPDWLTPDLLAPFLSASGARSSLMSNVHASHDAVFKEEATCTDVPTWEAVRSGIVSVTKELVMEDANWMPYLKQFLNTDKVLAESPRGQAASVGLTCVCYGRRRRSWRRQGSRHASTVMAASSPARRLSFSKVTCRLLRTGTKTTTPRTTWTSSGTAPISLTPTLMR